MREKVPVEAEVYTTKNRLRRVWQKFVRAMACIVVFCTTYALILPAITLQRQAICLMDEHQHGLLCYTQVTTESVTALACTYESLGVHVHGAECQDENGQTVCGIADFVIHSHDALCVDGDGTLVCELPVVQAHSHDEGCYGLHTHGDGCYEVTRGELTCGLHVHGESCYDPGQPVCGVTEEGHVHEAACYTPALTCQEAEHVHEDGCYALEQTLACGLEEVTEAPAEPLCGQAEVIPHSHEEGCYELYTDENGAEQIRVACGLSALKAHTHSTACFATAEVPLDNTDVLTCTEDHLHIDRCYGTWALTCGKEEHSHVESCYPAEPEPEYDCGLTSHTHGGDCYDAGGTLQCVLEEHSHQEAGCEIIADQDVVYVNYLIDGIPSADEIDARLEEFRASGDAEGEEEWYSEISQLVAQAYFYYSDLSDEQKIQLANAGKLLELEYIWSSTPYITGVTGIASADPTWAAYSSTRDFIELNIYDYNYGIHSYWSDDNDGFTEHPGFQWNGGAYAKPEYTKSNSSADLGIPNKVVDRHYVDSIDFGNSIITNHDYRDPGGNTNTYGKSATSTAVGKRVDQAGASETGRINWLWYDRSITGSDKWNTITNRPVGMSVTDEDYSYQSIANTLKNGYPALLDGTSLAYLFTSGATGVQKINTVSIEGLFQRDENSGAYSFNSRENHAQYDSADYDRDGDTNEFILFDQIITPNFITYPFGNFLPFNTITDKTQATQVSAFNKSGGMKLYVDGIVGKLNAALNDGDSYGDAARAQLITMLREYEEDWTLHPNTINGVSNNWRNLSAANAIRDFFLGDTGGGDGPTDSLGFITGAHLSNMYNIDWDVATNFFFGMEMKMTFMQPKNGMTGKDNNGDGTPDYPMVFEFTGDDDVWVFIDDILFLDLTGIHRHVGGKIDFVNGIVYYYQLSPETGDTSTTPYQQFSFAHLLRAAGRADLQDVLLKPLDANGNRPFKDYSTHTFKFYYTERGSGSSVCRMNFNFPLIRKNAISVSKENTTQSDTTILGDPDYYFDIMQGNSLFVGPNSTTGIQTYKIRDKDGTIIKNENGTEKVFSTDQYGIFTIKAGQTAIFEGIPENAGNFYVQELIKEEDNGQYSSVYINDVVTRYNELVDWQYRKYFSGLETTDETNPMYDGPHGYRWYGRSGHSTDSSTNKSFYFEQENRVDSTKLGQLAIAKVLNSTDGDTDQVFKMKVELDDVLLPKGTAYTVSGDASGKTVTEDGIIELKAGQTATISNIISGTKFEVSEVLATAAGFFVDYQQTGADAPEVKGNVISGIIRAETIVAVTVTNTQYAATVPIKGTKSLTNGAFAQGEHTYFFTLKNESKVDADGKAMEEADFTMTAEVTLTNGEERGFEFELHFLSSDYPEDTKFPVTHTYRITEDRGTDFVSDDRYYTAEVTVAKDAADGKLSASLQSLTRSDGTVLEPGEAMEFVNTLLGDLTLEKIVDGGTVSQTNDSFDFAIWFGENATTPLDGWDIRYVKNSDAEVVLSTDGEGIVNLTGIKHGDKVVLKGIPLGTVWQITESYTEGYIVDWTVNGTPGSSNMAEGNIPAGGAEVVYTNHSTYVLPETGGVPIPYTMVGLALMLFSAVCLMYTQLKRRREAM